MGRSVHTVGPGSCIRSLVCSKSKEAMSTASVLLPGEYPQRPYTLHSPHLLSTPSCTQLVSACAQAAASARTALAAGNGAHASPELLSTLQECALLCQAVVDAMAMEARTERDLRLICAAICHLCAEQCTGRIESWAEPLAALCSSCADACRQPPPRPRRRAGAG